ncbi:acyl-CoA dehydrogenase C-terminal domain-containing protein [Notoacmeibacter ruber]|uniref:3-methylmercaptopropionyl-CoA dehydrogenase n=1 Tax=Notoacmeibacter ruber TaxID=2670375 RepID=A0A3L7JFR9_9HYPH|nr:acyl-CoA dehydrogenase C-terminal domain-containing protein [Notoacmeibacter ruber]RLQ89330.1 acyl-CoA dehydrogenase [Notoacmeibacter ruber]
MPVYQAPVKDTLFVLNDVLKFQQYNNLPGFADADAEMVEAIIGEAGRMAEEIILPTNQIGDQEGCVRHDDSSVTTPDAFKDAFNAYREAGWMGLSIPEEFGGQNLPYTLHTAISEYFSSANMALMMYPGLTQGAIAALLAHGSDEQKHKYVPKMTSGEWTGTMNLTEPHCGTDLGLLRTKAVPQDDGSYKISGQKIFISAGEHDLADNIIHLVIARIEGAPEGTKGISLFVVPKYFVGEDGSVGERNGVACGSLEEKMGIHGNSTCVMNYDEATGWLVGEANKGLKAMFTMMNEARLGVALQGLSISEVAYQNAADYARERLQGRALTGAEEPDQKADPIIVHPDIRRTLLTIRTFNEGARALMLWSALKADMHHRSGDAPQAESAHDLLSLMTPVLKGVLTDKGYENATNAQQVYGGHGYIEEWGMSQFVRDARIAMIYEGANGIQALDLVGRKLGMKNGKPIMAFFEEVGEFCESNRENDDLSFFTKHIKKGLNDMQASAMWLMQNGMKNPNDAGAASTDFMHLFGLVGIGYMWGLMAKAAKEKLDNGEGDKAFYEAKMQFARYYMERLMPETATRLARIQSGSETMMAVPAEAF